MANRNLEKMASIDAQLRLLVPAKVSEDDKLVEYDALLLDRFLDILQDLHGEDLKETVSFFSFHFSDLKPSEFVLAFFVVGLIIGYGYSPFSSMCQYFVVKVHVIGLV